MDRHTTHTVTAKIPEQVNIKLENLAEMLDRKKGYIIRKAIIEYIEEKEDYLVALHRLEQKGKRYSLTEVEKECDLDN